MSEGLAHQEEHGLPSENIPVQNDGAGLHAGASVQREMRATVMRGDKQVNILVGGGARWRRLWGVLQILSWNRWAYKDARKRGVEFPEDAPRHLWQGKWRSAWARGNI